MNIVWLIKQAEMMDRVLERGRDLGVEDIRVLEDGASAVLVVRNNDKRSWHGDEELSALLAGTPWQYGGWLPAPRSPELFAPGTPVEVFCAWAAEPTFHQDQLAQHNDAADVLLSRNPDVILGWCPGEVTKLEGHTVHVKLQRRIVMEFTVGNYEIRVGLQSPRLRRA